MISDKIKILREKNSLTQAELARELGITRSGVNAWEMGISVPSTQYVVELAVFFHVSTDYLLDLPDTATVSVQGLSDREIASIVEIIECYRQRKVPEE
ncbi:MAG: helix-turn-helix transcriptional regulator [Clostridia bacterium]|nr:helix-turn-helix transcriptional regulator [Clostridia bacterium]